MKGQDLGGKGAFFLMCAAFLPSIFAKRQHRARETDKPGIGMQQRGIREDDLGQSHKGMRDKTGVCCRPVLHDSISQNLEKGGTKVMPNSESFLP